MLFFRTSLRHKRFKRKREEVQPRIGAACWRWNSAHIDFLVLYFFFQNDLWYDATPVMGVRLPVCIRRFWPTPSPSLPDGSIDIVLLQVPDVDASLSAPDVPSAELKKPKKKRFGSFKAPSMFKKGSKSKLEVGRLYTVQVLELGTGHSKEARKAHLLDAATFGFKSRNQRQALHRDSVKYTILPAYVAVRMQCPPPSGQNWFVWPMLLSNTGEDMFSPCSHERVKWVCTVGRSVRRTSKYCMILVSQIW